MREEAPDIHFASSELRYLLEWMETEMKTRLDLVDRKVSLLLGTPRDYVRPNLVELGPHARGQRPRLSVARDEDDPPRRAVGPNLIQQTLSADMGMKASFARLPHAQGDDEVYSAEDLSVENSKANMQRMSNHTVLDWAGRRPSEPSAPRASQQRPPRTSLLGAFAPRVAKSMKSEEQQAYLSAKRRTMLLESVWNLLENRDSSQAARIYERAMTWFIVASVVSALMQTPRTPMWSGVAAWAIEVAADGVFVFELVLRFLASPNRAKSLSDMFNVIDLLSGLPPLCLRIHLGLNPSGCRATGDYACLVLRGIVPVLRLSKLVRRFQQIHLLLKAFKLSFEAMPVLIYIYMFIMMGFAATLYVVEPQWNVESFSQAWWLAFVSMTTVGYGDMTPATDLGKAVVGFFVFVSQLYMAIPLGIIGNAFNDVWKNRDQILLLEKFRSCLEKAGYTPQDIPTLFKLFDTDEDGMLDVQEFIWMIQGMRLGLSKERIFELYSAFDNDKSGGIDPDEFIQMLFPDAYIEMQTKVTPSSTEKRASGGSETQPPRFSAGDGCSSLPPEASCEENISDAASAHGESAF